MTGRDGACQRPARAVPMAVGATLPSGPLGDVAGTCLEPHSEGRWAGNPAGAFRLQGAERQHLDPRRGNAKAREATARPGRGLLCAGAVLRPGARSGRMRPPAFRCHGQGRQGPDGPTDACMIAAVVGRRRSRGSELVGALWRTLWGECLGVG